MIARAKTEGAADGEVSTVGVAMWARMCWNKGRWCDCLLMGGLGVL